MTIVCGDSHTSTHGAFGALAFGIGTSEVEHVLATQTLPQHPPGHDGRHRRRRPARRRHRQGHHPRHHRPHRHRRRHRLGHRVPRLGHPRPVDGRPHDGVQHVDRGRAPGPGWSRPTTPPSPTSRAARHAPKGAAWEQALDDWRTLPTDDGADVRQGGRARRRRARARTSPGARTPRQVVADRRRGARPRRRSPTRRRASRPPGPSSTWASPPAPPIRDDPGRHRVHRLVHQQPHRGPAGRRRGGRRPPGAARHAGPGRARLVRGEGRRPRPRGSTTSSRAAGFEWREPGCSMCLAMNPDKLAAGERAASHQQPQLRGPPGPGRAHPPRVARRRRRHRRSPAPSPRRPTSTDLRTTRKRTQHGTRHRRHRHRRAARPLRRRHRPDHPERLAEAGRAHRLRRRACSPSGATTATSCSTTSSSPGASILVAGPNFGTGSSREHAVWAIMDYGFEAVISPRFADIFRNNCTKNGLVPVQVPAEVGEPLLRAVEADPTLEITIDVERRTVVGAGHRHRGRRSRSTTPPAPLPRGPRRHRHHPDPRRRHRRLRGHPPGLDARSASGTESTQILAERSGPWRRSAELDGPVRSTVMR